MLEEFLSSNNKVGFIANLDEKGKLGLYQAIAEDSKQRDIERIKQETILKGLEDDKQEILNKVAQLGFSGIDDLKTKYTSLCDELNKKCIEYAEIVNKAGGV